MQSEISKVVVKFVHLKRKQKMSRPQVAESTGWSDFVRTIHMKYKRQLLFIVIVNILAHSPADDL